jgi:hypothetical protein
MPRERTIVARAPRCRVPHCHRDSVTRGLCRSCYQSAYMLVREGYVTWQQLEDRGKCERTTSAKSFFLQTA